MNIFIGCSSSDYIPEKYITDCRKYIEELLKNNNLVFGASKTGIMGIAYDIAINNKCDIIGISPEVYKNNFENLECSKELITKTVNYRTESLIKNSDALIFLPGGIGTIYELFTAIESKRGQEFDKPIVIYNSCNYFDKLFEFIEVMNKEKFASSDILQNYHISDSFEDTINYLESYKKVKRISK